MKVLAVLIIAVIYAEAAKTKRYEGYKVVSITPKTARQLYFLKGLVKDNELDFWQYPGHINNEVKIMLPPHKFLKIARKLMRNGLQIQIFRNNVQRNVDKEFERLEARQKNPSTQAFNINDFNTYTDIMSWLDSTASSCSGGLTCTTSSIGNSHEGRELKVFRLTSGGTNKKAYFLDSAIHAREWLAPATNLKILNHLITGYPSDATVKSLVDQFDWYFLVVANPDGYVHSWGGERYWRKNRLPNDAGCVGTDLNRNYATQNWGVDGASTDGCSDLYCGSSPGSDPETIATSNEYNRLGPNTKAVISIHSFAKMWLHQYGYGSNGECITSPDYEDLNRVANAGASATENTFNQDIWQRGDICRTIYPAAGGTIDFTKDTSGIKYGFGIELRGSDFVVDASEIEPSFQELWNGVVAMVNAIG